MTIVAVLAGGRGSRLGGAKPAAVLGGVPLVTRVLDAAAGLDAVVVAKRSTELPAVDVPVWVEPDALFHPWCGLVCALSRGTPVVAVACDQPFVTGALLRALVDAPEPAVPVVDGRREPFPGRYEPSQLSVLEAALAEEWSLRRTLAALAPAPFDVSAFGDPARLVASVNTPAALAAAERELAAAAASPRAPASPAPTTARRP
ncbi:MAG TPA: NTP transferase domain-containing protein [Solirubrobacter sp.]|nr:NTP transferase domain-containing protein [Solirubrobacter sp.]